MIYNILFIVSLFFCFSFSQKSYYISPKGNDNNDGSISSPFKTFTKARDTIRALTNLPSGGVTVFVREGTYEFNETLTFTKQDSGSSSTPILYSAYMNESVVISGGKKIDVSEWSSAGTDFPKGTLKVDLKSLGITDYGSLSSGGLGSCGINKIMLFLDEEPMVLARYPNVQSNGRPQWINIKSVIDENTSFQYSGTEPNKWTKAKDLWLHGFWKYGWADNYVHVLNVSTANSTINLDPKTPPVYGMKDKARYYALNLIEELDVAKEYYLDRDTGELYFLPPSPLKTTSNTVVSMIGNIISFTDTQFLTLKNFQIYYSRTTAVVGSGTQSVRIENCDISNHGQKSLDLEGTNNVVDGCRARQNGCGGIGVRGGDQKTLTKGNNLVQNCEISDLDRWIRTYQPAISWSGVGNTYSFNNIFNGPHTAILGGGNDCIFEHNTISDFCYEVSDAGAWYSGRSWINRGNIIRYNTFKNIRIQEATPTESLSVNAVYFDDQLCDHQTYNNTFVNCQTGILLGGGRNHKIYDNSFTQCDLQVHLDNRGMNWQKDSCQPGGKFNQQLDSVNYQKPPWSTHYPEIVNIMSDHTCVPVYNDVHDNVYCNGTFTNASDQDIQAWLDKFSNNVQKC